MKKTFQANGGMFSKKKFVHAVNDVSFDIYPGETFSLVGESGCGKSTTGKLIDHLITPDSGEIWFEGKEISKLSEKEMRVYHPSGTSGDERQAFKMEWLEDFQKYVVELQKTRKNLILCGDYNICHEPIDIHDPVRNATNSGFLPEEREWMTRFLDAGFIDTFRHLNPEKQQYTWWSYRFNARKNNKGWRIDYCMVSEPVKPLLKSAYILNDAVHSDHCPAVLEIE